MDRLLFASLVFLPLLLFGCVQQGNSTGSVGATLYASAGPTATAYATDFATPFPTSEIPALPTETLAATPEVTAEATPLATEVITPKPTEALPGNIHYVRIEGMQFIPANISVRGGDTVVWTNDDPVEHTVTGTGFDAAVPAGTTFHYTFNQAGQYPYSCTIHPAMVGIVTVT